MRVLALILALSLTACGPGKKPSPRIPAVFQGRILVNLKHCHFLPDRIKFTCRDAIFDPGKVSAQELKK